MNRILSALTLVYLKLSTSIIIKSAMNKDNSWLLTVFSLFYVMQLWSIYFDILEIIGHLDGQSPVLSEHQK